MELNNAKIPAIVVVVLILVSLAAIAQAEGSVPAPEETWSRTFGGSNNDTALSVQQTDDAGYIVAGGTKSYGAGKEDLWLIKTDADGNELWSKTFGGSDTDRANSVRQTVDGGYIVAGYTESYGAGETDLWLIKTDADGNELWSKTFGGSDYDRAKAVQQTVDGGYIVAGGTKSYGAGKEDLWLIKTDADGNELWSKTFGGSESDRANSVRQTVDGGYIVAGYTYSYAPGGKDDLWLIKTDSKGNELWSKTFGGSGYDWAGSVQQTVDDGYIVAGGTRSYGAGDRDFWLIKTDTDGNEVWTRTFGGSGYDRAYSVQQTDDGGYIMAGTTNSSGAGDRDFLLIKTDTDGNEVWTRTFGGSSSDEARSVQQTDDGGYIVAGFTYSYGAGRDDFWLIKTIAPATVAENAINDVKSVISREKTKGLNVVDAETLLSQAEQAFNTGDYTRARELAEHAKAHALDVDNDGTPNDADFAPSIKNDYIYAVAAAFLLLVAAILIVKRMKAKEVRKIREYKAKIEQWEREGYDPARLKERWFK